MLVNIYTKYEDERGDFMKCERCGHVQLLKQSAISCKNCESDDLCWANNNFKHVSKNTLINIGYETF